MKKSIAARVVTIALLAGTAMGDVITSNVYPPFIDEGTNVVLSAPSGTGYQWKKDGADLLGATNPTLTFSQVSKADEGGEGKRGARGAWRGARGAGRIMV